MRETTITKALNAAFYFVITLCMIVSYGIGFYAGRIDATPAPTPTRSANVPQPATGIGTSLARETVDDVMICDELGQLETK